MLVPIDLITDINQTIYTAIEASKVTDFSRFSSLLEVAFALNISYKIIPDIMKKLGQQKAKKQEDNIISDWKAEISDRRESIKNSEITKDKKYDLNSEIAKFETAIDLLSDESDKMTDAKKWSIKLSKSAPCCALISIVLLFLGSLGICPLESFESRTIIQTSVVIILLLPNFIAIVLQVWHWKKIETSLENKTKEYEEKILPKNSL